jgi:membrane fusion protein (multidrug efflux system)
VRLPILLLSFLALVSEAFAQGGPPKVPVEAAEVTAGALSERVTAIGSLISNEAIIVRPEIAGRVVEIGFEEGQPVKKGDVLVKLDDALYQAELTEAEARLDLAKKNFTRTEELYANRTTSERARDEARSNLDVSTAAVALARVRIDKMRLVAPFDGIAGLRKISTGDYVTAGQDLFNLENIDPIKVDFRIAEKFLPSIRDKQSIQINVDAYPNRTFDGQVYAIDPRIDAGGRSIVIRAKVANAENLLRPGLFARVSLILELKPNALTVPEQAIVPRGDAQLVFQVIDGKAKQTRVTIGTRRDGRVEIVEGLAKGDVVVTAGHQKIRDGAAVTIINGAKGPTEGAATDKPGANGGKGA